MDDDSDEDWLASIDPPPRFGDLEYASQSQLQAPDFWRTQMTLTPANPSLQALNSSCLPVPVPVPASDGNCNSVPSRDPESRRASASEQSSGSSEPQPTFTDSAGVALIKSSQVISTNPYLNELHRRKLLETPADSKQLLAGARVRRRRRRRAMSRRVHSPTPTRQTSAAQSASSSARRGSEAHVPIRMRPTASSSTRRALSSAPPTAPPASLASETEK